MTRLARVVNAILFVLLIVLPDEIHRALHDPHWC